MTDLASLTLCVSDLARGVWHLPFRLPSSPALRRAHRSPSDKYALREGFIACSGRRWIAASRGLDAHRTRAGHCRRSCQDCATSELVPVLQQQGKRKKMPHEGAPAARSVDTRFTTVRMFTEPSWLTLTHGFIGLCAFSSRGAKPHLLSVPPNARIH
jgi:hypothetical protein